MEFMGQAGSGSSLGEGVDGPAVIRSDRGVYSAPSSELSVRVGNDKTLRNQLEALRRQDSVGCMNGMD